MLWNSSVATLVLVGTWHDWTWRLVNPLTTSMVGVSTVKRNKTKFGNNLRSLILNTCWSQILHQIPGNTRYSSFALMWWNGKLTEEKVSWWLHHLIQDLLSSWLGRNFRRTESSITLVVSTLTWQTTVVVILQSKTCVCITIMMKTLTCWNHSMPSIEKGSFGMIHNGRSYHLTCVHSLRSSHNLYLCRTWDNVSCLKICWNILMMEHCVALQCFWTVNLSARVCCKTCIMLRPLFQCRWSTFFHRGLPLSYLFKHWGRLISCQGVQRLVSENQLTPESLNWFLDFKMSERRHCLKCTLKIAVCSEELMEEWILCFNILKMLSYSFGNLVTMIMFTSCLCHSCIHIMNSSKSMNGVWSSFHEKRLVLSKGELKILLVQVAHHQMVTIPFIQISMVMFHKMMMRCWVVMNQMILWMMIINLITILDLIQVMMMIKSTSFQMIMDHHLMMIWICQEYRTRGKHINQVHHQLRFPILTFQSKRLLILDKMTILHQDLIRRQSLSEFKGNRDRSQLILLMLYQRQRQRWLSRGQRFNYQVMFSQFQFLLRNLMKMKMKDLHMILLPQVHMIIQFHCLLLHQHRLRQVTLRSQRNSSLHKEHQNWYHHNMMMMKQNHMKQTTLLFWLRMTLLSFRKKMWTLNLTHQTTLILSMLMVLFSFL